MNEKEIHVYLSPHGKAFYDEWFYSLRDKAAQNVIRARLARVRAGNIGSCRPVGDGVWELKIFLGPGYRIYYGQVRTDLIVLLCGGDKGSQHRDIGRAKTFWEDYRGRNNESQ